MAEYLDEEGQDVETQDFDINDPDYVCYPEVASSHTTKLDSLLKDESSGCVWTKWKSF